MNEFNHLIEAGHFSPLKCIREWSQTEKGVTALIDDFTFVLDVLKPGLLRIEIAPAGAGEGDPRWAVCAGIESWRASFSAERTAEGIRVKTGEVEVLILENPLRVKVTRADGTVALDAPAGGAAPMYSFLNDAFLITRRRSSGDALLGLGEKTGPINRAGRSFIMWNVDLLAPATKRVFGGLHPEGDPKSDPTSSEFDPYYINIPFYQSLDEGGQAAGFFMDNARRGHMDFSVPGRTRILFEGGRCSEFIFAGPSLKDILRDYTELTGRMAVPPVWSLGYHHCRWHPYSQEDVLHHARTYRQKGIPCDAIWLDIEHMEGYRVFTWNRKLMPEPQKMLASLKDQGYRTVTIVDPGVKHEPGFSVFDSGMKRDVFARTEGGRVYQGLVWPGKTAFPDFANPEARSWWGELNAEHVKFGMAGIWNDMNEPATGDVPPSGMRFDRGRLSHEAGHNSYALLMAMGTVEGLNKALPDQRTFVLSRAGSAGIQRYAANWLGDNMSRWDHLAMSVPMSLGLGLSGQPFVGADIGGFGGNSEPELLVRWMQAAVLSPFCRNHNDAGGIDQYPWSFGAKVEAACRAAISLRYRLMPYLYSAFLESSETGLPVMRPLVLEAQGMKGAEAVDDQYLLGPSLFAAPVVEKGARSRRVTLPPGVWFSWWTDEPHEGSFRCRAPLSQVPLFVREGSVIPQWPDAPATTMGYQPEVVDLHVFVPLGDGEWTSRLVEDDGETLAYARGERLDTALVLSRCGATLTLTARTAGAAFAGFRRRAFRICLRGACPPRTEVVEAGAEGGSWTFAL